LADDILIALKEAIINQDSGVAADLTKASLAEGRSPNEIIEAISDGLKQVGDLFENQEMFLPEVLRAANAAKRSLEAVIPLVRSSGGSYGRGGGKGTVAIGSLGPHDIGKTIIISMLIAAGFDVLDLGIMLTPDKVERAMRESPSVKILALSALLTSDIGKTSEIIKRVRGLGTGVKIMVGGAAMSPKVMREVGADAYGKDGDEAVKIARGFAEAKGETR